MLATTADDFHLPTYQRLPCCLARLGGPWTRLVRSSSIGEGGAIRPNISNPGESMRHRHSHSPTPTDPVCHRLRHRHRRAGEAWHTWIASCCLQDLQRLRSNQHGNNVDGRGPDDRAVAVGGGSQEEGEKAAEWKTGMSSQHAPTPSTTPHLLLPRTLRRLPASSGRYLQQCPSQAKCVRVCVHACAHKNTDGSAIAAARAPGLWRTASSIRGFFMTASSTACQEDGRLGGEIGRGKDR